MSEHQIRLPDLNFVNVSLKTNVVCLTVYIILSSNLYYTIKQVDRSQLMSLASLESRTSDVLERFVVKEPEFSSACTALT